MAAVVPSKQGLAPPAPPPSAASAPRRPHWRHAANARALAATRTFELDGGATAVAPTKRRPKGLVHFLGGAFVGAAPLPVYSLFLQLLAEGGYTCVATPYAVSFQHLGCSQAVHAAFESAVQQLRVQQGGWAAPAGLPVHGVGHSNGALLHLLIGSAVLTAGGVGAGSAALAQQPPQLLGQEQRASNVLISYNNFRVTKAVPVPLSLLAPAVRQLRGQGRLTDGATLALHQAAAAAQQLVALAGASGGSGAPSPPRDGAAASLQAEAVLKSLCTLLKAKSPRVAARGSGSGRWG